MSLFCRHSTRSSACAIPFIVLGCLAAAALHSEEIPPPVEPAFFNTNIQPGNDFFRYANGGWLKTAVIPADHTQWGVIEELEERNQAILRKIAEDCGHDAAPGSIRQKVGDFYASGMDEAAIESAGATPLSPQFALIRQIADARSLAVAVGTLQGLGLDAVFASEVDQDEKDSANQITILGQGGLGLPNCEYYTKDDNASKQLRTQYQQHVSAMLHLMGEPVDAANADASTVMRFESALAKASKNPVELRDPESNYHRMSLADLMKLAPGFDWQACLTAAGLPDPGPIDIGQPDFLAAAGKMAASTPLDDWKTYLTWHLLHAAASDLSAPFVNENFHFYGTILTGQTELRPRWERVLRELDDGIGEGLGQLYVEKNFPPEAKQRALAMVADLKSALSDSIQKLDWMGPETKKAALHKLEVLGVKIGYPDKWRDYSGLEIKRQPYVLNALAAQAFEVKRHFGRLGRPVDPTEWEMTPPTVNAYYNQSRNEVVFPAGILQPPNFDPKADDAGNYGNTGATIGHEMTHGFDDQGRQYDEKGNLKNWWKFLDAKRFEERGAKIVAQFDKFPGPDGLHVNGRLTEGENIADLGGLKIAYAALQKALARRPPQERSQKIDGLTPEQRFFIGYAQSWREKTRPEALKLLIQSDPHSPPEYRVNGPVSNLPEFSRAFGIAPGAPMTATDAARVNIW
jgi:predicted metalloendopeptidase